MDATELTRADIGIIRCLQRDARRSIAKIANDLRMPQSTVRHRLNKLVRAGVVQFTAATDPRKLGYQMWVIMEIRVEATKIRAVANQLAAVPEIHFIGITTGAFDVLATGIFRSNDDLLDFITTRLSKIPGIVGTNTGIILDLVKRTIAIGLPERPSSASDGRAPRGRSKPGPEETSATRSVNGQRAKHERVRRRPHTTSRQGGA